MPIGKIPQDVKTPGHDKFLAEMTKVAKQSTTDPTKALWYLIVILGSKTLQVSIRNTQDSSSELFTLWPNSRGNGALPAVLKPDGDTPVWGFDALTYPPRQRIENLRRSLETQNLNDVGSAIKNVGRFLFCALSCVRWFYDIPRYTFIIPSQWSEVELGRYRECIAKVIDVDDKPRILRNIELGACWIVNHMRQSPQRIEAAIIRCDGLHFRIWNTKLLDSDDFVRVITWNMPNNAWILESGLFTSKRTTYPTLGITRRRDAQSPVWKYFKGTSHTPIEFMSGYLHYCDSMSTIQTTCTAFSTFSRSFPDCGHFQVSPFLNLIHYLERKLLRFLTTVQVTIHTNSHSCWFSPVTLNPPTTIRKFVQRVSRHIWPDEFNTCIHLAVAFYNVSHLCRFPSL